MSASTSDVMQEPRRQNSFGLMRWVFALSVVYSHSFALAGSTEGGDVIGRLTGFPASFFGVIGFFVLSGYLNAGSLQQMPTPAGSVAFLVRRGFRIFPLLWVMLLVSVAASLIVAGPRPGSLATHVDFVLGNGFLYQPRWSLPGLFEGNPNKAVCGSLWTLPYEVLFYLILATTGLGAARGAAWASKGGLAGLLCAAFHVMPQTDPLLFGGIQAYWLGLLGWSFLAGVAIQIFPGGFLAPKTV